MCFECLRFRLRLSVNGRMTYAWPNCHLALQKFWHLFYWKWPNGNLARHLKIKNIYIFSVNGWMVNRMTHVWPNCHSAIYTQTQTQMETEGYRMHRKLLVTARQRSCVKVMFSIVWVCPVGCPCREACLPLYRVPRTCSVSFKLVFQTQIERFLILVLVVLSFWVLVYGIGGTF